MKYLKIEDGYRYDIVKENGALRVLRIPIKKIMAQDILDNCKEVE